MTRILILLLIYVSISFSQYKVQAQVTYNPDSALQNILSQHKGTHLSVRQAVENAVNNAAAVRISEAAYLSSLGSVRRETGFFDPVFFINVNHQKLNEPTASFFAGAPILSQQQTNYQTGISMFLPTGAQLELSVRAARLETNSAFAFLNPEYGTFGSIGFRQPLLNGFTATAREQLTRSERTMEAQKARYDQQLVAVSSQAEQAYWDLYAYERNYAVQQLTRDQAEALLRETELREKAGLVGPVQVANAKTFLAEQELLLLDREEQLDRQSDFLASLMGIRPEKPVQRFLPADEPPENFPVEDVEVLVELAVKSNLDLQAAQKDIEAVRVQSDAAKWRTLPRLDLTGSLTGSGLAGSTRDVIFGGDTLRSIRQGSFSNAIGQVGKREFPGWNVGVELNLPIGFRKDLGEKDRLEAEEMGASQRYVELSRLLEEQVRQLHREIDHGKRRTQAALAGVNAAQEQVRIGLIEFHNGRSTAFELVRLGADLAAAQQRYSAALVRTVKAAAMLKQITSGKYTGTFK